jgi:hypothetical protein
MVSAKDIRVAPIKSSDANKLVQRLHYSGKVVRNSQLHLGVFLNGHLEGVMQFGPSLDKRKIQGLVEGTRWNGFIELNRIAFSERLPRNSESRALSVAFRLIRNTYPEMEWIVSFADGTQCGDGIIYRASGFVLTGVKKNQSIIRLPSGKIACKFTYEKCKHILETGAARAPVGSESLLGFQLRYIYFLNAAARERLTVPVLPFSRIDELGAGMYRGKKKLRAESIDSDALAGLAGEGGADPTSALHFEVDDAG